MECFACTEQKGATLLKRSLILGMTFTWMLVAGTAARADLVPWSYNWSPKDPAVFADSPGTGKITFTNEPSGNAVGTSDIVATNLKTFSTADPATPDTFTNKGYTLFLTLTDKPSGQSTTFTFNGVFNGTISSASSNITNTFTNGNIHTAVLGGNTYTVTIGQFTPPPPPGASNSGSISATAIVSVRNGPPNHGTPEPSSLVLAGLGLTGLGFVSWRKRRHGGQAVSHGA
jgi:hypothetical protein